MKNIIFALALLLLGCRGLDTLSGVSDLIDGVSGENKTPAAVDIRYIDCCDPLASFGERVVCEEIERSEKKEITDINGIVYRSSC